MKTTMKLALVAGMTLSIRPLLAVEPVICPRPMPKSNTGIAAMIPGEANAAAFFNLEAIKRDYGMIFDGGPVAEKIDELVKMGLPDPRKTIDQVALAANLEGMKDDRFLVLATGSVRTRPIADLAAQMTGATIEEEAYRGVTMLGLNEPEKGVQVKLGDLTESAAFGSFDRKNEHAMAKTAIEVTQGQGQSYGEKYGSKLGANDYLAVSVELPKELRKDLEKQGQLAFLSLVVHARAALVKTGDKVRLALDGVCMDEFDAETVKRALAKGLEKIKEQYGQGEYKAILESIQLGREDKTVKLSLELPEQLVKDILGGLTGNN